MSEEYWEKSYRKMLNKMQNDEDYIKEIEELSQESVPHFSEEELIEMQREYDKNK